LDLVGMVLGALWSAVQGQVDIVGLAVKLKLHDDWSSSELKHPIADRQH
jgi:hypothetical protein